MAAAAVALSANAADWYLHTSILGNSNWESVKLTQNGDWYEYTSNKFVPGEFGIKEGNNWIGGGGVNITEADVVYDFNRKGGNSKSTLEGSYTFRFNPTENKVEMQTYSGEIHDVIAYAIHGQITGNQGWASTDLEEGEDGVWSLTRDFVTGNFGIKKMINGSQPSENGWFAYSCLGEPKDNCESAGTDGNIKLTAAGNYTISFDPATTKITVKFNGGSVEPPVDDFNGWYVHLSGSFNKWDSFNNGVQPDTEGLVKFEQVNLGDGWFKIHVWNGQNDLWYSANGAIALDNWVEFNQVTPANVADEATTLEGYSAGNTYDVQYNCATNKILVKNIGDPSGVAAVEAANGEAVYFNMQGVRVANPENGLFIRVQNGKAVKVVK